MNLTRWFALGSGCVFGALVLGYAILREEPVRAHTGFLPALCSNVRETVWARSASDLLDPAVHALSASNGGVILLAAHSWMRARNGTIDGPFGGAQRGAPGYLADPQDAVITDSAIYVLDSGVDAVRVFAPDGAFRRTVYLEQRGNPWWQPRQLVVTRNEFVVSALEAQLDPPAWSILRWRTGSRYPERLFSIPGSSINAIVVDPAEAGIIVGEAAAYRIHSLDSAFAGTAAVVRSNPPLYPFSQAERRRYRRYAAQLPPDLQRAYELPRHLPPLAAIKQIGASSYAAALTVGADSVHVEIINGDGTPLCRLTRQPVPRPFAMSDDGVVWLDQSADDILLKMLSYDSAYSH